MEGSVSRTATMADVELASVTLEKNLGPYKGLAETAAKDAAEAKVMAKEAADETQELKVSFAKWEQIGIRVGKIESSQQKSLWLAVTILASIFLLGFKEVFLK